MRTRSSQDSIAEASRWHAEGSHHGGAGAGGWISPFDGRQAASFLSAPGDLAIINRPPEGLPDFDVGMAWNARVVEEEKALFGLFFKRKVERSVAVDMDIGCLYELRSGARGAVQAFGETRGAFDEPPYLFLDGDERTGESDGRDEVIHINGARWDEIRKILVYTYIYGGADSFGLVRPQVQLHMPDEKPVVITLNSRRSELALCAVATIENIRGGIRLTTHMEYFPGHGAMDRAFGYGLEWEQGAKPPVNQSGA